MSGFIASQIMLLVSVNLELEEKGKVLIVAPDGYFKGGSLAKDKNQIIQIYEEGYEKARMISDFIYFSNPSGSLER